MDDRAEYQRRDDMRIACDVAHDLFVIRKARWALRRKLEEFQYRDCRPASPVGILAKAIEDYLNGEADAFNDSALASMMDDLEADGSEVWRGEDATSQRMPLAALVADAFGPQWSKMTRAAE
jgi:hypothetical protein